MDIISKLLTEVVEAFGIIIGAVLAILGGIAATWYRARKTRQIRIDEIMAERQVEACRQAYKRIKYLSSMMIQCSNEDVMKYINENEEWFFDMRLFFPGTFSGKWLSIRKYWRSATRMHERLPEGGLDEQKKTDNINKITDYESHCEKLAEEAIAEIERKLNIGPIQYEAPSDTEHS